MLTAVGMTLLGSSVYHKTAQASAENYTSRTALSYVAHQVRHCDRTGGIEVGEFHGADALLLYQTFAGDDTRYVTQLYYYDGYLRELFTEEGVTLDPDAGIPLIAMRSMLITESPEGQFITVHITSEDGEQGSLALAPRSGIIQGVTL